MRVAEAEAEVVENGRGKCFFLAAMAGGVFSTKRDDLDFFRVVLGVCNFSALICFTFRAVVGGVVFRTLVLNMDVFYFIWFLKFK